MKKQYKFMSVVFSIVIFATCFTILEKPKTLAADSIETVDGVAYSYYVAGEYSVISGVIGAEGSLTVPSSLGGHPVITFNYDVFQNNNDITELIFPETVQVFDDSSFSGCGSLKKVIMPSYVQFMGNRLFKDCTALETVILPDDCSVIKNGMFENCVSLRNVAVGSEFSQVKDYAVENCKLLSDFYFGFSAERMAYISTGRGNTHIFDAGFHLKTASVTYYNGETKYAVRYMYDNGGEFNTIPVIPPCRNHYDFGGWYRDSDYTPGSEYISGTPVDSDITVYAAWVQPAPPSAPAGVKAEPSGDRQITVSWEPVKNASQYNIYRFDNEQGQYVYRGSVYETAEKPTEFKDGNLEENEVYYYKVVAVNKTDDFTVTGEYSSEVSAGSHSAPAAPGSLFVSADGDRKITVRWFEVSDATQYDVYRSTGSLSDYEYIDTVYANLADSVFYSDTNVYPGTYYSYKVASVTETPDYKISGELSPAAGAEAESGISVPENVKAAVTGSGQITVSWSAVPDATSYGVYRCDGAGNDYILIGSVSADNLIFVDESLEGGEIYCYKVNAVNESGEKPIIGVPSSEAEAEAAVIPGIPDGVASFAGDNGTVYVYWNTVPSATRYDIYRSSGTSDFVYIGSSNLDSAKPTAYNDTAVSEGTYRYKVKAVTETSGCELVSGFSAETSVSVGSVISAPQDIDALLTGDGIVTVSWSKVTGASGYVVCRSDSADGEFDEIGTVYVRYNTELNYTDKNLEGGETYYYRVYAFRESAGAVYNGKPSDSVYITVAGTPEIPSDVTAAPTASGRITVSWSPVNGADGYGVYRYDRVKNSYIRIGTVLSAVNPLFTDDSCKSGETYYYKVNAFCKIYGGTLNSGLSSEAFAAAVTKPDAPLNVNAVPDGDRKITVSWSAVSGSTQYNIYRCTGPDKVYSYIGTVFSDSENPTSFGDTTVYPGKIYYYKIAAVIKTAGSTLTGDYSEEVSAGAESAIPVPENIIAKATGEKQVTLSWSAVDGATDYGVYRYDASRKEYVLIGNVSEEQNSPVSFTDFGCEGGKTYCYKINAVRENTDENISGILSPGVFAKALEKPEPPENISASGAENGTITVEWSAVDGATQYNVYRTAADENKFVCIGSVYVSSAEVCLFTDSAAYPGQSYYYRVTSVIKTPDCTLTSEFSSKVYASAKTAVAVPANVNARISGDRQITVSWAEVTGADGYNIYKSSEADGEYTLIGTVTAGESSTPSFMENGCEAGRTVYYKVNAFCTISASTVSSMLSAEASAAAVEKPDAPEKVKAAADGDRRIKISWSEVPEATQYIIYRYNRDKEDYTYKGTVYADSEKPTEFVDKTVCYDTDYSYKVASSIRIDGCTVTGDFSGEVRATALSEMAVPENVRASATAENEITVRWYSVNGATSYNVYRFDESEKDFVLIETIPANSGRTISFTDKNLTAFMTYTYKINAISETAEGIAKGKRSPAVSAAAVKKPDIPSNVASYSGNDGNIYVSWQEVEGASGYEILRTESSGEYVLIGTVSAESSKTAYIDGNVSRDTVYGYKVAAFVTSDELTLKGDCSGPVYAAVVEITEPETGDVTEPDEPEKPDEPEETGPYVRSAEIKKKFSFGGSLSDNITGCIPDGSGNYYCCGFTGSKDGAFAGAVSQNMGQCGFFAKVSSSGELIYLKTYGDVLKNDYKFTDIALLSDGDIAICGYRYSYKAGSASILTSFIMIYGDDGTMKKAKVLSGEGDVMVNSITAAPCGFAVCGNSESKTGDFAELADSQYATAAFIFTYDGSCGILNKKFLCGSYGGDFRKIDCDASGNIFSSCVTMSNDGDYSVYPELFEANTDSLIIKFNSSLEELWYFPIASSFKDSFEGVAADGTGGCVVAGYFERTGYKALDGTLTGANYYLGVDSMLIKISASGALEKQVTFNGAGDDYAKDVCVINGGYAVVGYSTSHNGDYKMNHGAEDGFVIPVSPGGRTVPGINIGGSGKDFATAVASSGNTLIVFGNSSSSDFFFDTLNTEMTEQEKDENMGNCCCAVYSLTTE